jgi:hypothetical protein
VKPLAIDLFCGLGGWAEGFLSEGYDVIGFDIERHDYGTGGYPGQLVLQDVTTLHGSQFRNAAVIVASPPCQAYSYRAMPWKRAKALPPPDNTLFEACFQIQREASEAAGHPIPLVVENVRGAEKWVGPARWHFGSYYLWGDIPALMPLTFRHAMKIGVAHRSNGETNFHAARASEGRKLLVGHDTFKVNGKACNKLTDPRYGSDGIKNARNWWSDGAGSLSATTSSHSNARKAASAQIAKIPFPLAQWIAKVYKP